MILPQGAPIFDDLPIKDATGYVSPFPSSDAVVDGKYDALLQQAMSAELIDPKTGFLKPTLGQILAVQNCGQAWHKGSALVNAFKAWRVGDLLNDWLPELAWVDKKGAYGGGVQGLFAGVTFPQSADPKQIGLALARVALNVALGAIQAVPMVGQVVGALVLAAEFLVRLFNTPSPAARKLMVPWTKENSRVSEALVRDIVLSAANTPRWTGLWMPPYEKKPWSLHPGMDTEGKEITGGEVWAPLAGSEIAYSQGLGAIPNTLKCCGHVQRMRSVRADVQDLVRKFYDNMPIGWGSHVTDVGSFFPDPAQICGGMWQQVMKVGNPDMYKVDALQLQAAWEDYFGRFFADGWDLYKTDPSIGEMLAPYIAVVRKYDTGDDVRLGIPNMRRPHPAPFVTPSIFKAGPATPATRTHRLWLEEDTVKRTEAWPYDALVGSHKPRYPRQHPNEELRHPVFADEQGDAKYENNFWEATRGGAGEWVLDKKAPAGYRWIPWPTGEELLVGYAPADVAVTTPACQRLRELQLKCLTRTFVAAYVRPFPVQDMERYEAFGDKPLRDACVAARQLLLTTPGKNGAPPPRWNVNLKDVDAIDPEFATALRASGVTNSVSQLAAVRGALKSGAPDAGVSQTDDDDLPAPLNPAQGVAFDDLGGLGDGGSSGGGALAIAAIVAGLGLGYAFTRRAA